MLEDSMKYIMDEGWFDMASLVAIASCTKQLHALVDRADHLWKPFLAGIKFPQTGFIDDKHWKSPDIPPPLSNGLRVPPRINGGRRDDDSFFVHPRDRQARGRGLVLGSEWSQVRFDQTNGILQDRFHGENESVPRSIHMPSAFLRAPMDQDGIDRMISDRESVLHFVHEDHGPDDTAWEDLLSIATLWKVKEASIELVVEDFYDAGMEDNYALDVILGGWQAFSTPPDLLYCYITGLD